MKNHRFKHLYITGGFLGGFEFDFSENLNCIIGARGAGKTTVLEFLRYALDAFPLNVSAQKKLLAIVEHNLEGGRIEVTVEADEGYVPGMLNINGVKYASPARISVNENLFIVAAILVTGLGGLVLNFGKISVSSIACALILGIIVNLILKPAKAEIKKEVKYENPTEETMFGTQEEN